MAIYNIKFILEQYKSSYLNFDDNDEPDEDDDDNEEDEEKNDKDETKYLSKDEIRRITGIISGIIDEFEKLKKCCDYIDLSDKDKVNDDGERESSYDSYYSGPSHGFIKIIDGEILTGYPDYRQKGAEEFNKDSSKFIKKVNEVLEEKKIPARFSEDDEKDDESIAYRLKSTK